MGELRCVDGSILTVTAVACNDRLGVPYEVTLDLSRAGEPFASVGERCGFRLTQLAGSVTAAREDRAQAAVWPDPDDRFPEPGQPGSAGRSVRPEFRPGDREYFSLRSRDRSDLPGTGELRCVLREPGGAAVAGCASGAKATTAGMRLARFGKPSWRQRGRVRDGSTRSRLPALRAQNRSVAFASGDPQARRGDVRR